MDVDDRAVLVPPRPVLVITSRAGEMVTGNGTVRNPVHPPSSSSPAGSRAGGG